MTRSIGNMLFVLTMGMYMASGAAGQTPATPSNCSSFKTSALESDPAIVSAATTLAAQMIGNYDNANSTAAPPIQQFWGPFNITVLQEMRLNCQASARADTAVKNAVTAQAVTSQTNKQVTAPSAQSGGTSIVQQVGVPQLLALAIENGAIANNVSGTTMTLSTTPYAFFTALSRAPDTQQNYNAAGWATHTGISASFNVGSSSDPLASATRKQVSAWQVKATFRDTSIRSAKVASLYDKSALKKSVDAYTADLSNSAFLSLGTALNTPADSAYQAAWAAKLQSDVAAANQAQDMTKSPGIAVTLLKILDGATTYQNGLAIAAGQMGSAGTLATLVKRLSIDQADFAQNETAFEKGIADLPKGWNGDIAFSEQFPTTVSPAATSTSATATPAIPAYFKAELDLTCEPFSTTTNTGAPCPLRSTGTFTFNASGMFYPNPAVTLHEKTFRGAQAALQGQWTLGPGFVRIKQANDDSKMTLALSGNYERLEENKDQPGKRPDIAIGNIKLSIPISAGVAIPLSFTAATAGEQISEKYVRGNFGLTFDLDKLAALLKANQ